MCEGHQFCIYLLLHWLLLDDASDIFQRSDHNRDIIKAKTLSHDALHLPFQGVGIFGAALKEDVAAVDVAGDTGKLGAFGHGFLELGHADVALAADVDASEEGDVCHRDRHGRLC